MVIYDPREVKSLHGYSLGMKGFWFCGDESVEARAFSCCLSFRWCGRFKQIRLGGGVSGKEGVQEEEVGVGWVVLVGVLCEEEDRGWGGRSRRECVRETKQRSSSSSNWKTSHSCRKENADAVNPGS